MLLSAFAHLTMLGAAFAAPYLSPKEPPIRVADVFAVALPPGGGGPTNPEPPAPAAAAPETKEPEPAKAAPPPTLIKPPTKNEPKTKGLPVPDAKVVKKMPKKDEPAKPTEGPNPPSNKQLKSASGAPGGKGTNAATPGLDFGPSGPGVPGGNDWLGDWYFASVQRKIWSIWMQQVKTDFNQPITIRFTILQDGTLGEVDVVQSSGAMLLDMAAKRAIYSAAPFGPLPKSYGTTTYTINGIFRPAS
jgi:TonB family protein